jgi:hypothetical protein
MLLLLRSNGYAKPKHPKVRESSPPRRSLASPMRLRELRTPGTINESVFARSPHLCVVILAKIVAVILRSVLTTGRTDPALGSRAREALTGAPRKPAGALGCAGLWLFPRSARPAPAEDAIPEVAAFGDQAPRGAAACATAGRTARDPATPAHGACHDRNRPHEALFGRAIGMTWQSHAIAPRRRLRQSDSAHHGPRREAGGLAGLDPAIGRRVPRRAPPLRQDRCRWRDRPASPRCRHGGERRQDQAGRAR